MFSWQSKARDERIETFERKAALLAEAQVRRKDLKENQLATFRQEAKRRQAVLRKLQHVDGNGTVLLKGRAACEVSGREEGSEEEANESGIARSGKEEEEGRKNTGKGNYMEMGEGGGRKFLSLMNPDPHDAPTCLPTD